MKRLLTLSLATMLTVGTMTTGVFASETTPEVTSLTQPQIEDPDAGNVDAYTSLVTSSDLDSDEYDDIDVTGEMPVLMNGKDEEFEAMMNEEIQDYYYDTIDNAMENGARGIDFSYEVVTDGSVRSIVVYTTERSGSATNYATSFNYDLATSEMVDLSDVLGDDYVEMLNEFIGTQVDGSDAYMVNVDTIDEDQTFYVQDNTVTIIADNSQIQTEDGSLATFKYSIGTEDVTTPIGVLPTEEHVSTVELDSEDYADIDVNGTMPVITLDDEDLAASINDSIATFYEETIDNAVENGTRGITFSFETATSDDIVALTINITEITGSAMNYSVVCSLDLNTGVYTISDSTAVDEQAAETGTAVHPIATVDPETIYIADNELDSTMYTDIDVMGDKPELMHTANTELEDMVNAEIDAYYDETIANATENGALGVTFSYDFFLSDDTGSIVVYTTERAGSATNYATSFNFDMETGEMMDLSDVIGENYMQIANDFIGFKVEDDANYTLNTDTINEDQTFYIDDNMLTIVADNSQATYPDQALATFTFDLDMIHRQSVDLADTMQQNGEVYVPLRKVAEGLGFTVGWDDATRQISVTGNGMENEFAVGESKIMTQDGVTSTEYEPMLKDGMTYVPVQYFSDYLDVQVSIDDETGNLVFTTLFTE